MAPITSEDPYYQLPNEHLKQHYDRHRFEQELKKFYQYTSSIRSRYALPEIQVPKSTLVDLDATSNLSFSGDDDGVQSSNISYAMTHQSLLHQNPRHQSSPYMHLYSSSLPSRERSEVSTEDDLSVTMSIASTASSIIDLKARKRSLEEVNKRRFFMSRK